MASLCGDTPQSDCTSALVFLLYLVIPVALYVVGVLILWVYRLVARRPKGEDRAEEGTA